jgi:hypothetical protein
MMIGVPPADGGGIGGQPAPPAQPLSPLSSWVAMVFVLGVTISTVAGGFITAVLYLRPVIKKAEQAMEAGERAAKEMEVAAQVRAGFGAGCWSCVH